MDQDAESEHLRVQGLGFSGIRVSEGKYENVRV